MSSAFMKKTNHTLNDDMRPEYDFASMKGGVRGKYAHRAREGTNIVLIEPAVADAFPTERAVNEALKGVLNTTRAVRRTGGLPNPYQPSSGQGKRSSPGGRRIKKTRDRRR
jgi:hypothetical protein